MLYLTVKYVHIFLAIVAVGFNMSYAVWLARAKMNPEYQKFALEGVKFIDDRIANPCYGFLLVSGGLMVWLGHIPLDAFWIDAALVLYALMAIVGVFVYTPTLRKQIDALRGGDPQGAEFTALAKRGQVVGQLLALLVAGIIVLMVFKPGAI